MKLCITATGKNLDAQVDPRFGRAEYFIIIDPDTMAFEALENASLNAMHGAGIQAAQLMSTKGVTAVITGQVGPNAFHTLKAAGIEMFHTKASSAAETVDAYKKGQLKPIAEMGAAHAGMGGRKGTAGGRGMN
ncbi:NifB/NifX family molybdenum-iron cluster-binding protein [candidate division KSB1 bacterium]|nr:NifB/NifX family molybdenum-iron cluster-binding protein [candidate division KSB1 bacterium]